MRIVLVRPGAGSPEFLSLEGWQSLTSGAVVTARPGDPLADRLREAGYEVEDLDPVGASANGESLRGRNLLAHTHGDVGDPARAVAAALVARAQVPGAGPEIVYIAREEDEVRAVFTAALEHGAEIEVVIGTAPHGHRLLDAVALMARLRGPGGCPWDAEQTHESLAKHLLDETYEVLQAIDDGDSAHLSDELGDLLLQVLFHAQMARDAGTFDIDDVAHGFVTKLTERHPHVFGDVVVGGAGDVVKNWDEIKARGREGTFAGIPESLPALAFAQKVLRRAASAGVGVPPTGAPELTTEDALGETLLAIAAAAQEHGLDAEQALRRAATAWRARAEEGADA